MVAIRNMNKNLLYLFLFSLIGCGVQEKKSPTVYFAGEIVNPTSDYVVLHKDDVVIDSARLDKDNRFSFALNSINDGLYHFDHSPELQYVFLENGDSLLIRLNTVDFDESLVFTGTGEEINNFLLEMFLANEEEEEFVNSLYTLEAESFGKKIDSLRELKIRLLNDLASETELSEKAIEMGQASIDYNCYIYKEKYPFKHKKRMGENTIHNLPKDFYGYRKDLNLNNGELTYFRPYYNFMAYHIGNLSYMNCTEECDIHENVIKNQLHFNRHKLKLIDSLVNEKSLRENLFRNVAIEYLLNVHDNEENNRIFINEFHEISDNKKHISEIDGLYKGIKNIQPNLRIPNIEVYDVNDKKVSLQEIVKDNNIVFYFWTGTQIGHFNNITKRVAQLTVKYPEYTFVGINFNTEPSRWLSILETNQLDKTKQYRADNFEDLTHTLIINSLNKGIIIKDGFIENAFADLFTSF